MELHQPLKLQFRSVFVQMHAIYQVKTWKKFNSENTADWRKRRFMDVAKSSYRGWKKRTLGVGWDSGREWWWKEETERRRRGSQDLLTLPSYSAIIATNRTLWCWTSWVMAQTAWHHNDPWPRPLLKWTFVSDEVKLARGVPQTSQSKEQEVTETLTFDRQS